MEGEADLAAALADLNTTSFRYLAVESTTTDVRTIYGCPTFRNPYDVISKLLAVIPRSYQLKYAGTLKRMVQDIYVKPPEVFGQTFGRIIEWLTLIRDDVTENDTLPNPDWITETIRICRGQD